MSFEIKGLLHKAFPTENKTASFQAREFVITVEDRNYTNFIKFQLTQDRCSILDVYKEGDEINVFFDLRGREWQDKYFTNLNAWKIERVAAAAAGPADSAAGPSDFIEMGDQADSNMRAEDFDDLPF